MLSTRKARVVQGVTARGAGGDRARCSGATCRAGVTAADPL